MELIARRNKAIEFCNDNLDQCCIELIERNHTGLLRDGKVRELCNMLDFASHSAMALAEEIVKTAAMESVVLMNMDKQKIQGLTWAVAVKDKRKVTMLFDTTEQANAFVAGIDADEPPNVTHETDKK